MYPGKILVILYAPFDAKGAEATIQSAMENAATPDRLCFTLPSYAKKETEQVFLDKGLQVSYFDYTMDLSSIEDGLKDETYFLLLMGDEAFSPRWDNELFLQLHALGGNALLTASIWHGEKNEAQLCLPALKDEYGAYGFPLGCGLPVVNPKKPVSLLLADPALVFGPAEFLAKTRPMLYSFSYDAMAASVPLYLLEKPLITPVGPLSPRYVRRRQTGGFAGAGMVRYERTCGILWNEKMISAKGKMGLNELQNTYPQVFPLRERMKQRLRTLGRPPKTYFVTGYIDFDRCHPDAMSYCLRFGFLSQLSDLTLLVYTGGETEKAIRRMHINSQAFPGQDLPCCDGMSSRQHFLRSKIFMLSRAAARYPENAYYAWVDFDILPHPLPQKALPNLKSLNDGKLHMALVEGVPDTSFIFVPASMVQKLKEETLSITQMDEAAKRGYSEGMLWLRLSRKFPEDFHFHPMPRRRLLFLSLFSRKLLSRQITQSLDS